MLATRMFFWWGIGTPVFDSLKPAVTVEAARRVFTVPAHDRVFVVKTEHPGS